MKKRLTLIGLIFLCPYLLFGQAIYKLIPRSPSLCEEASLPAEMQRKLDRIVKERAAKTMSYGQIVDCSNAFLKQSFTRFIQHNSLYFFLQDTPYQNSYIYTPPKMVITNSSRGHELIRGSQAKFNAKKDRLSSVILDSQQRLYIINRNDEICDPSAFQFTTEGTALHIEGNRIVLDVTPREIALGKCASEQRITVTHLSSNTTYHYNLAFSFDDSLSWRGQKKAFALMEYPTPAFPHLGLLLNLTDKKMTFVQLPLTIHGEGTDGRDGGRGLNGPNGTNTYTWTDKEGKSHTVKGTCGKPGGNGEDGTDGTDGGQYFIALDKALVDKLGVECVTAWIDPGLGGSGGKGGQGGLHGRGSGCIGKARDGADGRHGKNGQRGDFLYVIGDMQSWIKEGLK